MPGSDRKQHLIQLLLFVLTLFTTTIAGADWIQLPQKTFTDYFLQGLFYSIPFLGVLTIHEFGHYIAAKIHKVSVTLPYYIPFYLPLFAGIGTLGAFIKIKSAMKTRKIVFDVGIAGPLAGFVAALLLLWYGFTHLPQPDYVLKIHEPYATYGLDYDKHVYSYNFMRQQDSLFFEAAKKDTVQREPSLLVKTFLFLGLAEIKDKKEFVPKESYDVISTGSNLLFLFFEKYVAPDPALVPNKYEMIHYPFLFAGFLALFFTALNLIPIGQLDGGHILYALIGSKAQKISAPILFTSFVFLGTLNFVHESFDLHPTESFDDLMSFAPAYLLFLYMIFSRVFTQVINNILLCVSVFAVQFFVVSYFPDMRGFEGWWVFALIIGRFLGIYHPPSPDETPLDTKRKILGWLSLFIFIICFSPQPLVIEFITK